MNCKVVLPFNPTASFMATAQWLFDGLESWHHQKESFFKINLNNVRHTCSQLMLICLEYGAKTNTFKTKI